MACRKRKGCGAANVVTCKMLLNALEKLPEEELNPVFEIKRPGTTKSKATTLCEGRVNKRERLESVDSDEVLIFSVKSRSQKRLKLLGNSVNEQGEGSSGSGISRILLVKDVNIQEETDTNAIGDAVDKEAVGPTLELALELQGQEKPRLDSFSSCSDKLLARPEALNVSRIDLHSDAKKIKIGQSAQSQPSLEFDVTQVK